MKKILNLDRLKVSHEDHWKITNLKTNFPDLNNYVAHSHVQYLHSHVPRPSTPPVFDCLQYATKEAREKTETGNCRCRRPGNEANICYTSHVF